jgi:hypothetical protein
MAAAVIIILSLTAFLPQTTGSAIKAKPGGFLSVRDGTLRDPATGQEYTFDLIARESEDSVGSGQVTLLINGPGISLCSAHGPGAEIDFSPGGEDFSGNNPLQEIQCGTAYGMTVSVDACAANVELHGYSHSDHPFISYMGPMTLDLAFRKSARPNSGTVMLKLYTVKGQIKLNGNLTAPIEMDTCN